MAPVRLVAPLFSERVGARRPLLRWGGVANASHTVEVCRDRACAQVVSRFDVVGLSARPPEDLRAGRYFWRVREGARPWSRPGLFTTRGRDGDGRWGVGGDVDGDGFDDVAAVWTDPRYVGDATPIAVRRETGCVEFRGATTGLHPSRRVPVIGGSVPTDPVVLLGDVDGDGYGDALGGLRPRPEVLQLGPYTGSSAGLVNDARVVTTPLYYTYVRAAGDLNGDGYADAVVVFNYRGETGGGAYAMLGGREGFGALQRFANPLSSAHGTITGAPAIGDFDADGFSDVVLCAGEGNPCRIYRGRADWPPSAPTAVLDVPEGHAGYGAHASSLGDVNGDGYADFLVTAIETDTPQTTFVYFGAAGQIPTVAARRFEDCRECIPPLMFGAGDVDGDGFDDVVQGDIGAPVRLFRGGPGFFVDPPQTLTVTGRPFEVARDIDGDGDDELFLREGESASEGRLFMGPGGANGPSQMVPLTIPNASIGRPVTLG